MNTSEYLLKEYKALTDRYTTASRHLKELLYQISALPADEKPDFKAIKEILLELHKLEELMEYVLSKLHDIFHQLMILTKEDKPKKKAIKAPKTKRTAKSTKPVKTSTSPKKQKRVKRVKKEKGEEE
jgi:hypothetical protein